MFWPAPGIILLFDTVVSEETVRCNAWSDFFYVPLAPANKLCYAGIMIYQNIQEGRFLTRPNRFIAYVRVGGQLQVCHVKNTGRCKELLVPDAKVLIQYCPSPNRKTNYDLIAVWKGHQLINMDSAAPNQVFGEFLRAGGLFSQAARIQPEYTFGDSRFGFYVENITGETHREQAFIEVKGVTLEQGNVVRFPDAPTERGLKHLHALTRCVEAGYQAYAVFIIQMEGVKYFEANWETHPAFGQALRQAAQAGVKVLAWDCQVSETSLILGQPVPVHL